MNKKPLLISAAVLCLCGLAAFQWRDQLLGRVGEVHTASVKNGFGIVFPTGGDATGPGRDAAQRTLGDIPSSRPANTPPVTTPTDIAQAPRRTPQAAQPAAPSANPQVAPVVDESALRYFAARGDTARLQAEIARLKALYPNWTPPADPTAVAPTGDAQLETMWQLYANGRYAEVRKAIADRQSSEAGWQPPDNLIAMLNLAEARQRLVNASDLKQYNAVIDVASANPGLLTCSEVDVLWRVAEAFARTDKLPRARDAYDYVLTNCDGAAERLATMQKASTFLPVDMMEALLSREKPSADGQLEFEPIKDELARQFVAKAGDDPKVTVPPAYLMRLERLAESEKLSSDALLLGWYYVRRERLDNAETWFRRARQEEDTASASQGLALALIARGEPREAEDVMYKWRGSSDDARAAYLAAAANLLALDPPLELEPDILQRMATEAVAHKDALTAQEFGWYSRAFQQPQLAQQWFATALRWKPDDEPSAYGLTLSYQELNNQAEVRRLQQQWGSKSQRILDVGRPVAETDGGRVMAQQSQRGEAQGRTRVIARQAGQTTQPPATAVVYQPDEPVEVRRPIVAPASRVVKSSRCATHIDPETLSPQSALQQGWCLMEVNRPAEAVKAFAAALKGGQSTVRSDAAYGQSLAYLRMGLTDNAAVSATKSSMDRQKATELQVAILTDRALAAYQNQRYEEALILLDQRARFATDRIDLMVIRGYAYLNMKRYADAIRIFEGAAATGNADAIRGLSNARDARPSRGPQGG